MKTNWIPAFAGMTAALIIAGCATPPPIDPASRPQAPAAFKEEAPRFKPVTAAPPQEWWRAFGDALLRCHERSSG